MAALLGHPLVSTLRNLRGNVRACVFTEPLWGIPYNLFAPYVSVYMLALGLKDSQIGLVISIGMGFQILAALMSGAITDKLGRKRTTFIFDIFAWTIACLVWAVAQNFAWFVVAAIVNSLWRVSLNSWSCLLVEDTVPDLLVDVYAWIYISGMMAAFFAPLAGLLIDRFTLVPTGRGLYFFAAAVIFSKILILNRIVTETQQGQVRLRETQGQSLFALLGDYHGVFRQILRTPGTLYTIGIMIVTGASNTISTAFWPVFTTGRLRIPAQYLALYPFARSIFMLLFFFLVLPRIRDMHFKQPMLLGFALFALSHVLLITAPGLGYLWLLASTFLEACGLAMLSPQVDRMMVVTVDAKERARILAIIYVIVILVTSPFGWIAGLLSEANRVLPFLLNIALFALGGGLVFMAARSAQPEPEAGDTIIIS